MRLEAEIAKDSLLILAIARGVGSHHTLEDDAVPRRIGGTYRGWRVHSVAFLV